MGAGIELPKQCHCCPAGSATAGLKAAAAAAAPITAAGAVLIMQAKTATAAVLVL